MVAGERGRGVAAMLTAGMVWGLSPLFYKQLAHIPALEVASHRVVSSFLIFAAVMAVLNRFGDILRQISGSGRSFRQTALAAAMISVNWFVWILAVQLGYTTEASLGYFIFPLFAVFLGAAVFREKLTWIQWLAVATAAAAVIVLTAGLGTAPWIALVLSTTFTVYGLIKKRSASGPAVSVAGEALIITPFALLWLFGTHVLGWTGFTGRAGGYFGADLRESAMLVFSGVLTAGPLMLMSYSIKRLGYAEIGFLQYTNPTLQFLVAVFIFMEPFGSVHLVAFSMIWLALALYSADLVRHDRRWRRTRTASEGDPTTENS